MAACIDNSTKHCIYLTADSSPCQITNSICRLIRLCRPGATDLDSCNPIYQYASCINRFEDSCKVGPQEFSEDHIWLKLRQEAEFDITQEPILSKWYHSAVLSHSSLESALANQLSIKLSNAELSRDALHAVFLKALVEDSEIQRAVRDDLKAVRERDPACVSYVHCLLNFKGFLACQAHRLAHNFWVQNRTVLALLIQSRVSEVFAMDIHPGARIGRGVMFDHGTGIVIGETAVIGNNVTILHDVTLGGTGKVQGDRHPKIGDGVLIGAGAKVLGNVKVGENAKIGAGSIVLKEIPARGTAVGNPARLVGFR
ncbi:Serine acetyltransferase 1, chloroplastic [Sesamum alatum]|uniref:serine O-acetyltransferase n=1 Tax=Sesamum alatum TaxID=300844 RepID=A0AAE2CYM3_9LAMI|nr:Serine acetyltransferase 1, chloroplastic [Sesamum alatum]